MDATTTLVALVGVALVAAGCTESDDDLALLYADAEFLDVYDRCETTTECGYGSSCFTVELDYGYAVSTDAMCTRRCEADEDCDYGGRCVHPAGKPPLCHQRCMGTLDCWIGYECLDLHGDHDPVCAPG